MLPSMGSEYATGGDVRTDGMGGVNGVGIGGQRRRKKGLIKAVVDWAVDWIGETGEAMGLWRGERTKGF